MLSLHSADAIVTDRAAPADLVEALPVRSLDVIVTPAP